jgi:hypothetical protein
VTLARAVDRRLEVVLGLLCFVSYAVHGWHYVARRQEANLLWFCHLAALAIGLGLLVRSPTLNAVGFLWLCVGTPCWLLYLASGGELVAGSVLTHGVGLAAGAVGLRRLGLPAGAWWKALVALAIVHALSRVVTPPAENVNLAFAVWSGWESWFPSHVVYLARLTTVSAAVFLAVTWALRTSGFAPPALER